MATKTRNCVYCKTKKIQLFTCVWENKARDFVCAVCVTRHPGQFLVLDSELSREYAYHFGWLYSGDVNFWEYDGAWYRILGDKLEVIEVLATRKGTRLYTAEVWLDLYFDQSRVQAALDRLGLMASADLTWGAFINDAGFVSYNDAAIQVFFDLAAHWGFSDELEKGEFFTEQGALSEWLQSRLAITANS